MNVKVVSVYIVSAVGRGDDRRRFKLNRDYFMFFVCFYRVLTSVTAAGRFHALQVIFLFLFF